MSIVAESSIADLLREVDPLWCIRVDHFDPEQEREWESNLALSNGMVGLRASLELGSKNRTPASYFAGVFDKPEIVDPKSSAVEDVPYLANTPAWNLLEIEVDGTSIDFVNSEIIGFQRVLDMRHGLLLGEYVLQGQGGVVVELRTLLVVSRSTAHHSLFRVEATPRNFSGEIATRFITHLNPDPVYISCVEESTSPSIAEFPETKTGETILCARVLKTNSRVCVVAQALADAEAQTGARQNCVWESVGGTLQKGETRSLTRYAAFAADREGGDCVERAQEELSSLLAQGEEQAMAEHLKAWEMYWGTADIQIDGDDALQRALRWDLFHLIQLGNPQDDQISISATGLHGMGYFGHAFWDTEIFMLPFYLATNPTVANNLLLYRHHRLDQARQYARATGYQGARFPWMSADSGHEATPPDWAQVRRQIHISGDIALAFRMHHQWTGDNAFFTQFGIEVIIETARFYASWAKKGNDGKYHLLDVIGPDEYHFHADDNTYTNHLARWNMREAVDCMDQLQKDDPGLHDSICKKTGWGSKDRNHLQSVVDGLAFPRIRKGVCEQFRGFFDEQEPDDIKRNQYYMPIDRGHYKDAREQVVKQADVVMLHYLFPNDFNGQTRKASYLYYEKRCLHGSSLSPFVHSIVGLRLGLQEHAYGYFHLTALMDLGNLHLSKNAAEGIHVACAGGAWITAVQGFGGVSVHGDVLRVAPQLPRQWQGLEFTVLFRGSRVWLGITHGSVEVRIQDKTANLEVCGQAKHLNPGESYRFEKC